MSEWNGVPENPEKVGAHELEARDGGARSVKLWHPGPGTWHDWSSWMFSATAIGLTFSYVGPCLTPSEVERRVTESQMETELRITEQHLALLVAHPLPAVKYVLRETAKKICVELARHHAEQQEGK